MVVAAFMLLALGAGSRIGAERSLREEMLFAAARQALPPASLSTPAPSSDRRAGESPPPCLGDVCQPQVSVPGYAPAYRIRGARTRLTLEALDRLRLEPVATVAWWIAVTGVSFDYTPAAMDAAASGGTGVARGRITLAWHIDAWGSPTFGERRR